MHPSATRMRIDFWFSRLSRCHPPLLALFAPLWAASTIAAPHELPGRPDLGIAEHMLDGEESQDSPSRINLKRQPAHPTMSFGQDSRVHCNPQCFNASPADDVARNKESRSLIAYQPLGGLSSVGTVGDLDWANPGADRRNRPPCGACSHLKRYHFSLHVFRAHPAAGRHILVDGLGTTVDITYSLNERLSVLGAVNLALTDQPRFSFFSANAQTFLSRDTRLQFYLQGGPGIYRDNEDGIHVGLNLGVGAIYSIATRVRVQGGVDLHQVHVDESGRFVSLSFGVLLH